MAEPLTSSDIIRERMGFGVSPLASAETRRAYAAAGLSPLGTQERERFERGGALSPMAGTAEKEAWKMAEFQAGRREQAPIEYGGQGDRPLGSSRRAIRMQEEWDKKQTELLNQQRLMQQMENEAKQMEAFDLDVRLKERQLSVAREEDIFNKAQQEKTLAEEEQAFKVINSVRGQPNAYESASEAIANLPYAAASERVQKSLWTLGQSRQVEEAALSAKEQRAEQKRLMDIASDARQSGASEREIAQATRINPETLEVYTNEEELRRVRDEAKLKEKTEGAREPARTRVETLRSEVVGLEAEVGSLEAEDADDAEISKAKSRLANKKAQLEAEEKGGAPTPQKPKEEFPKFDTVEAALAAGLKSGTVVEIGGKKARID
jgi:hypothetical protein